MRTPIRSPGTRPIIALCETAAVPSAAELHDRLAALPRVALATLPTPIHELRRLSAELGVRILVKRDDLTGLAFGGNKVRQAEFFVGEAVAAGADVVLAGGSYAQSNHARVCAAGARAAGLAAVVLVRPGEGPTADPATGNALVTRLVADEVRTVAALQGVPRGDRLAEVEQRAAVFESVAAELRAEGRNPYVLVGSSAPMGVMGYVAAALELHEQRRVLGLEFSKLFVTSLGVTQAGLELATRALGEPYDVVGIAYQPTGGRGPDWIVQLLAGGAALLGVDAPAGAEIVSDDATAGPAYGVANEASREALALAARSDALLLDPIYTAKGFAGLLRWIRDGRVRRGDSVLFLHTGGLPALFAYRDLTR
jgi:1-aminocyclopropane-1-carboxylate deaminase/D-cysteine desulfhydrase-like pyridoxal-dependent ACC family enzyme